MRDSDNRRVCTISTDTLNKVLDNCIHYLKFRDRIYIEDVASLLEKALEYVKDDKDLSPSEIESIKKIREMIKGL